MLQRGSFYLNIRKNIICETLIPGHEKDSVWVPTLRWEVSSDYFMDSKIIRHKIKWTLIIKNVDLVISILYYE